MWKIDFRWSWTVCSEMNSRPAIWRVEQPWQTSAVTARFYSVSAYASTIGSATSGALASSMRLAGGSGHSVAQVAPRPGCYQVVGLVGV